MFAAAGFHRLLDARLALTEGGVRLSARLDDRFESLPGRAHGGVVASLLDTAATWALIAETRRLWTTVDLRTDYLHAAPLSGLEATGAVLELGRRIARARSELRDPAGRVCAVATGTFVPVGGADVRTADVEERVDRNEGSS